MTIFGFNTILLYVCYLLNPITIILYFHCSKIFTYQSQGPYEDIGHKEFKLKSGTWISVYYPCNPDPNLHYYDYGYGTLEK